MSNKLLFRLAVLVAAIMSALGAAAAEAYACYTSSNTTLTFYYDNLRSTRTGSTHDLNTGEITPIWYRDGTNTFVTKVIFDSSFANFRPTTTYSWFYDMKNLQSITGISNLNTSEVTNMRFMFCNCSKLTSLDLSHFNTSKVTDMGSMFWGCSSFASLDLSSFNTAKVTKMDNMFLKCTALTSLDLSSFNTANVTDMSDMFFYSSNLRAVYVGNGWKTTAVIHSEEMFSHCTSLVGGQGTYYDSSNPMDKTYAHIDGGYSNPGYFRAPGSPDPPVAYACYTSGSGTLTFYYDNQRNSRPGVTYNLNSDTDLPGWNSDGTYTNVYSVVFDPSFADAHPKTTCFWFSRMANLQTITGLNYLNTSDVTAMISMFNDCGKLTNLELSNFNTSKVTDMNYLFYGCSNLIRLDLSSFNTYDVTSMRGMFNGCTHLRTIYVGSEWSVDGVTNSADMFKLCTNLVGGRGTTYNSSYTDKTYAHIDGGTANPGYFTDTNAARAYACYTPSNNTLTFYYDTRFGTRPGTSYNLNIGNEYPAWTFDGSVLSATNVVFDPSFANFRPTSTYDWFGEMEGVVSITGIDYLNTGEVTNMAYMFYGCTGLRSIDLTGFNTSKVTDMNSMFNHCNSLTSLDLSSFNTARVTDMSMMFQTCLNLKTIYVGSGWTTSAVTSSDNMFYDSRRIVGGQGTTYNSNHIDKTYAHIDGGTSNPGYFTDIQIAMLPYVALSGDGTTLTFYKDGKIATHTEPTFMLNEPDKTPGWSIYSNVSTVVFDPSFAAVHPTYMGDWFNGLRYLTSIQGLENLNTSEVTSMKSLFNGCTSLVNLDLRYFETGNVTDMNGMFRDCSSLRQLDLSSFDTRKVTDMNIMFRGCTSLESLDLSSFDTHSVTRMIWMFYNCSNLTTIYAGISWDVQNVSSSAQMFTGCTSLVGGKGTTYDASHVDKTYARIDGGTSNPGYFTRDPNSPEPYACYTEDNTTLTFYCDSQRNSRPGAKFNLNEGNDMPKWYNEGYYEDITKVVFDPSFASARPTSTYHWFAEMYDLTSIEGMQYLNTSEVTNMAGMFWECGALTAVDVSGFDTRKVTDMSAMFAECYELTALDVTGWNTSYVTDMSWMFSDCSELTCLDVSHFNTSNVTNMRQLFDGCSGLTSLDVSNFDTSNVTDMSWMFSWCNGLQQLDLSGFNTSKVTNMSSMFNECETLRTIYVGDSWTTAAVTSSSSMFDVCHSLVGGKGTTYSSSNPKDKTYAHIDGGTSNPGYFSEKGGTFLRGDVNGDGSVNISDVTALIDYLLSGNASGINLSGADCNQDSSVNISDVTALIDYLLSNHW